MRRYQDISILTDSPIKKGKRFFSTVKYPEIPLSVNDIYVITTLGDRLDLIAQQFYNDSTLYWIISSANPNVVNLGSLFVSVGTELRIPTNISAIKSLFNQLNNI